MDLKLRYLMNSHSETFTLSPSISLSDIQTLFFLTEYASLCDCLSFTHTLRASFYLSLSHLLLYVSLYLFLSVTQSLTFMCHSLSLYPYHSLSSVSQSLSLSLFESLLECLSMCLSQILSLSLSLSFSLIHVITCRGQIILSTCNWLYRKCY